MVANVGEESTAACKKRVMVGKDCGGRNPLMVQKAVYTGRPPYVIILCYTLKMKIWSYSAITQGSTECNELQDTWVVMEKVEG
jgi:hypothetical protein